MFPATTRAWTISDIPHLECFRAVRLVHEYPRHSHSTWTVDEQSGNACGMIACGGLL